MYKNISVLVRFIYLSLILFLCTTYSNHTYARQEKSVNDTLFTFQSEGSILYGRIFKADADNHVPAVIMLQGFPGREGDIFGIGKMLNAEKINALTFNYRGSWKSGGTLSPAASLQDVINLISLIKTKEFSEKYNIDTSQIILLGYSYGSSLAMLASLEYPSVKKVISLSTTDWSVFTDKLKNNNKFRKAHQAYMDKVMSDSSVVRSLGGKAIHEWLFKHKDEFNLVRFAESLSDKQILLLGGWQDYSTKVENHVIPLYRALTKYSPENTDIHIYDTNHSFKGVYEKLYKDIISWIRK